MIDFLPFKGVCMKNIFALLCLLALCLSAPAQQSARKLKVFISVDMEGVSGVVSGDQTAAGGADYNRMRRLMTDEANAAIDGARDAGATEIIVNDSHGSMRNLQIEELHAPAELISNAIKPMGMMQGIDSSFDAVIFVGYHAKAGSAVGVLAHTGTGTIADVRINGRSVGEGGMNTLAAGALGVPVVMITGDQAAIAQARELVPNIEGVQVKEAIGTTAARSLRPQEACARIREAAKRALERRAEFKPVPPAVPATFEIAFTQTVLADVAEQIPTVKRVNARTISYQAADYLQGYRLLRVLYRYLRAD
jgi:D-amino peptidase